ncbi:uncharacterized protein BDZ99DRAFT_473485 [Mytilinidion resinicola]|uniref:AA9 family lytic polysaccharide monooxygenase n=1 Tax=Mytilinidion resinicola TaxID=574789 RepID=A0A6A6YZS3_9PEZI|nr:uncharacterized protein BDZ99DRAFT_473485 [Mytilinidion resinicola]KAF2814422.1 hypothetical protein BDZ99DRAFT_473485 [Mytilinidion resinicola]
MFYCTPTSTNLCGVQSTPSSGPKRKASFVATAHTIAQRVSVNGNDFGQLVGIRSPDSDNPIQDVSSGNMACNTGFHSPVSSKVIDVPVGAKVGVVAKVDNAASSGTSGLKWFKVSQDGLDSSEQWGVDRMISNGGWTYFTMPNYLASGNYLLRAEIIGESPAGRQAQFYLEWAQINVTGGGSANPSTVSFPSAYSATNPGILINIYDNSGNPTGGGKPYTVPGAADFTC